MRQDRLRDLKKAGTLERIRLASTDAFATHGFEATKMRAIARSADVALGTLFNYATNKRDLLFLVINRDLAEVISQCIVDPAAPPNVQSLSLCFKPLIGFFAERPKIARIALQEMTFYREGQEAIHFQDSRQHLLASLKATFGRWQSGATFPDDHLPELLASAALAVFAAHIREELAAGDIGVTETTDSLAIKLSVLFRTT